MPGTLNFTTIVNMDFKIPGSPSPLLPEALPPLSLEDKNAAFYTQYKVHFQQKDCYFRIDWPAEHKGNFYGLFYNCDFSEVIFTQSEIRDCVFVACKLEGLCLAKGSTFIQCTFINCNFADPLKKKKDFLHSARFRLWGKEKKWPPSDNEVIASTQDGLNDAMLALSV